MAEDALIQLPQPVLDGDLSVEKAIAGRRSRRHFRGRALSLVEVGQLLWAAGGITDRASGKRAAPSAGARYPLELYAVLPDGLYRYRPAEHALERVASGDARDRLADAADQEFIAFAPCTVAISAVFSRTTARYGQRGEARYVPMDVGHAAENLLLQAAALGMGGCPVGAFDDEQVARVLQLPPEEQPLYLLPVGVIAGP